MVTKKEILNNLREYSASDIVQAIQSGEISIYELSKSGKLSPLMKKRIEELLYSQPVGEVLSSSKDDIIHAVSEAPAQKGAEIAFEQTVNNYPPVTDNVSMPPIIPTKPILESAETGKDVLDNKGMFKRTFSFKGRIRRTEYGISYIIFLIWYFIFLAITEMNDVNPVLALFMILTIVPAYWFLWARGAKRCHDRGNSGWYQIIPFYFFVMLFGGSEEDINGYGTNPKE